MAYGDGGVIDGVWRRNGVMKAIGENGGIVAKMAKA